MGRLTFALFAFVCLAVLYQSQAKPLDSGKLLAELLDLERREGGEGETHVDGEGSPRQDGNTGVKRQYYRCLGYGCWQPGDFNGVRIQGGGQGDNNVNNQGNGGQGNRFTNGNVNFRGVKRQYYGCQGYGCWPQGDFNGVHIQGGGQGDNNVNNQGNGGHDNEFKNGDVNFGGVKRQYYGCQGYGCSPQGDFNGVHIQGGGQGDNNVNNQGNGGQGNQFTNGDVNFRG